MRNRVEALARLVKAVEAGAEVCIVQQRGSGVYKVTVTDDRVSIVAVGDELEDAAVDGMDDWETQRRLVDTRPDIKALR